MKTELVFAFPRALIMSDNIGTVISQGVKAFGRDDLVKLAPEVLIVPRHRVEVGGDLAPTYVHIATYTLLGQWDQSGALQKLYRYSRTKKGSESLLHGNTSVGVGGHVGPRTPGVSDHSTGVEGLASYIAFCVMDGNVREIREEVGLRPSFLRLDLSNPNVKVGEVFFDPEEPDNSAGYFTLVYAPVDEVSEHHLAAVFMQEVDDVDALRETESHLNTVDPWVPEMSDPNMEAWTSVLTQMAQEGRFTR